MVGVLFCEALLHYYEGVKLILVLKYVSRCLLFCMRLLLRRLERFIG